MARIAFLSLLMASVVASALAGSAAGAAFPGTNGRIVFTSPETGADDVYSMNADGSDRTRLTNFSGIDREPTVSPDGSIAFTSTRTVSGDRGVYVMHPDGSSQTGLTDFFIFSEWEPAFSADGSKLAFVSDRGFVGGDIWVMNCCDSTGAEFVNATRLTDTGAPLDTSQVNANPTYSPDGSKIAFVSNRDDDVEIYVMDADGSDETRLTDSPQADFWPSFSPDGSKIAFTSARDGHFEIYTMNVDGTDEARLTDATHQDYDPGYSPDGSKIVFTSTRSGKPELWTMDADGTDLDQLTDNDFNDAEAEWGVGRACTVTGTLGNDRLKGTAADDVICGFNGNDRLAGRGGDDTLSGDLGLDDLVGGPGSDSLDGGPGFDSANYNPDATEGVSVDLASGTVADDGQGSAETVADVERVEGARNQANQLTGDGEDNKLIGGVLADTLDGGDGADLLRGEPERAPSGDDDTLTGGDGADTIFPGLGSNTIFGDGGSDTLDYSALAIAAGVFARMDNGEGTATDRDPITDPVNDSFFGIENLSGTPNDDSLQATWDGVATFVRGREGADFLFTGDGDVLDAINGGAGVDNCIQDVGEPVNNCP